MQLLGLVEEEASISVMEFMPSYTSVMSIEYSRFVPAEIRLKITVYMSPDFSSIRH